MVVPGDRIAVVGPSGSGKSTLLHLLSELDTPTSGRISWPALGPRTTLRPKKIGFIFQAQSLLAPLTVAENVELSLLLGDIDRARARAAALDMLERMDLGELAEKLPEELSGGQMQRVAWARTLACRPKMILADEPTGQLDHPTAQHLFDTLLAILEDSDTALVVATHDKSIADRLNKKWYLQHGRLEVVDNV
jgi:putative ABC transport system ATP-binding protein/lipoprotein-releasing system ATP-binding protein